MCLNKPFTLRKKKASFGHSSELVEQVELYDVLVTQPIPITMPCTYPLSSLIPIDTPCAMVVGKGGR